MRRSLIVVAVMTAPILASAVLPATANSAVRASSGSDATVTSVSCAPGGDCAAGGHYFDASFRAHAFVLTERSGRWGTAIEVPGLAALSPKNANISSVSCAPGGCAAGGYYQGPAGRYHAFVTNERNGRWGRLVTVFSASRAPSAVTEVGSLSCSGPENCAAGGGPPAFVVSEVNGRWGRPHQFGARGKNGRVKVSCTSAGNCSASWKTFVVSERNGQWGKPMAVPGLSALGTGAGITSLSCTAAANCAVGGIYRSRSGIEVFVASKRNGRWGKAIEIPGFTALNKARSGLLAAVSCISAGNCVAGGSYAQPADFAGGVYEPFVASERNGHWGKAIEVPGIPPAGSTLCEPDSDSCVAGQVLSVSCAAGGTCAVGGSYDTPAISGNVAFVAIYKNGRWTKVTQIPGLEALDTAKSSAVNSVSCTPTGKCAAGGRYSNTELQIRPAFVADENNGTWDQAHTVRIRS
jgi:hypothetical protein